MSNGKVVALSKSQSHTFHKINCDKIQVIKGLGVDGDAHKGAKVKHRSRVAKDSNQPNLRQIHLIQSELHVELAAKGFTVKPGEMGENVTTKGIDLLALPKGTLLFIGDSAVIEITGLRNPCRQLDQFKKGLMKAVLDKDEKGNLIKKAGVMGIIIESGLIQIGDLIEKKLPKKPHAKLERV